MRLGSGVGKGLAGQTPVQTVGSTGEGRSQCGSAGMTAPVGSGVVEAVALPGTGGMGEGLGWRCRSPVKWLAGSRGFAGCSTVVELVMN